MAEMTDAEAKSAWEALGSDVATHFFAENPDVKEEEGWQTSPQSKMWLEEYKKSAGRRRKKSTRKKTKRSKKTKRRSARK